MRIFCFFVKNIFFRKVILSISIMVLLFMSNYVTFTAARSVISTVQGFREIANLEKEGIYIANLDPMSNVDTEQFEEQGIQSVYEKLNREFKYAFYTDGYMIDLPNDKEMDIIISYLNDEYYKLNPMKISKGKDLTFDYALDENMNVPVLVGSGLGKTYPVGSTFEIMEPALGRKVVLEVQGILEQNASHSNFYAPNSKNYYNFSIMIPIHENFLEQVNDDLKVNGLMDLAILDTTREEVMSLSRLIEQKLNLKFNFFSQSENFDYFKEYYFGSLKVMGMVTLGILVVITLVSVWSALVSVKLMMKEFSIHLFVGLSYRKLRRILCGYYGVLGLLNLLIIFLVTANSRYGCWVRKDASFATYGLFGLIGMDWFAFLIVLLTDFIVGALVVGFMMWKIKQMPISLGVIQ